MRRDERGPHSNGPWVAGGSRDSGSIPQPPFGLGAPQWSWETREAAGRSCWSRPKTTTQHELEDSTELGVGTAGRNRDGVADADAVVAAVAVAVGVVSAAEGPLASVEIWWDLWELTIWVGARSCRRLEPERKAGD